MSAPIGQLCFNVNLTKMIIQRGMLSLRRLQIRACSHLINRVIASNAVNDSYFHSGYCFEKDTKTSISYTNSNSANYFHTSIARFSSDHSRLKQALISHYRAQHQTKRNNSSNPDDDYNENDSRHKLKLMDFPILMWPNLIKKIRSWFMSVLIIGYFDNNFSTDNFMQGALQAVAFVSENLSKGQFSALQGLVSHEALSEIRRNYADLNSNQRRKLAVIAEDIFLKFIYEIGVIFEDETNQRFVEITVVLQGFHGLEESEPQSASEHYRRVAGMKDQIYVCNYSYVFQPSIGFYEWKLYPEYRFIREFTKGIEGNWTINKLNHFLPLEQKKLRF